MHPYARTRPVAWTLIAFWLLLASFAVFADVTFEWDVPTTREDGSPLAPAEIAGYKLDWTLKGVAQPTVNVPPGVTYTLVSPVGRVCATLKTVDTDGLVSDPSNQACKNSRPSKPGNFGVK